MEVRFAVIALPVDHGAQGLTCIQIATAGSHLVLLGSDGSARGINMWGKVWEQCADGCVWAALSSNHGAFLKEDGSCYTIGDNLFGQCDVPQLPGDLRYRQVALGAGHTVLLRSDGSAVAHGSNRYFHCDIPSLS